MNSELKARYKVLGSEKEHTKSETLTETLIEVIVNGDVEPGSKISEPELARKYQVSRGPLREALMRLEGAWIDWSVFLMLVQSHDLLSSQTD